MKRCRFDFFKGKKNRIKSFVFTKMTSFRLIGSKSKAIWFGYRLNGGLVRLGYRLKGGSVLLGYQTSFRNKILYRLTNRKLVGRRLIAVRFGSVSGQ
jgi:hypothetical protein